jgi:DNA-binding XRE family transcriptional regulator
LEYLGLGQPWTLCLDRLVGAPNISLTAIADLSAKDYSHDWSVSSDICIRLGKRLKTLRKGRQWSQVYMAEHVGIDRSFISDLENGKKEVCIRNLQVLADAFEMSLAQLLTRL